MGNAAAAIRAALAAASGLGQHDLVCRIAGLTMEEAYTALTALYREKAIRGQDRGKAGWLYWLRKGKD